MPRIKFGARSFMKAWTQIWRKYFVLTSDTIPFFSCSLFFFQYLHIFFGPEKLLKFWTGIYLILVFVRNKNILTPPSPPINPLSFIYVFFRLEVQMTSLFIPLETILIHSSATPTPPLKAYNFFSRGGIGSSFLRGFNLLSGRRKSASQVNKIWTLII